MGPHGAPMGPHGALGPLFKRPEPVDKSPGPGTEDKGPGKEDMCGRLNFSMYGTRSAATNWQAHYTKVLVQNGFTVGLANNCTFYNEQKQIHCMVHGDDFISTGPDESLKWMEQMLEKDFKIN